MAMDTGGKTLSDLHKSSREILIRTRAGLERLERLEYPSSSSSFDSPELASSVLADVSHLETLCSEMYTMWRSIGAKSQRDIWNRKIEQVEEEAKSFKASLDNYYLRSQRRTQEARERAELLERTSGESSHILRIFDDESQAMQSARNSSRSLEESYATGVAVLKQYADQKERLKRAQRKALDVLNTVGLSNSVLKLIERRSRVDQWIKYVGMFLTIIILVAFWRWTR